MDKKQLDVNVIIQSLSNQIAGLAFDVAEREAVIEELNKLNAGLEEQLSEFRNNGIEDMNKGE